MRRKWYTTAAVLLSMCMTGYVYAQEVDFNDDIFESDSFNTEINADQETELVIEDFNTTGLGDKSSYGVSLGGLFAGSALLDMHFDIYISPLVAVRFVATGLLPLAIQGEGNSQLSAELGFGAVWRSYVINRTRFYGGVVIKGGVEFLKDFDLLIIPEGFGGFEIYASPAVAIFTEFGGRSAINIIDLNGNGQASNLPYGSGFFFRIGTRFDL